MATAGLDVRFTVLSDLPAVVLQVVGGSHQVRFQLGCHGVVPGVEESEVRDDGDDLDNPLVTDLPDPR